MIRTYKYRCQPTKGQLKDLDRLLGMTRSLYNAALQERIDAYKKKGITISKFDQFKSLTDIRKFDLERAANNVCIDRDALERLDLAFKAFFKRVKKGEKPGFPRFKPASRWHHIGIGGYNKGKGSWKLRPHKPKQCRLYFKGMRGTMRVRMHRPIPANAVMKTAGLTRDSKGWYICIALELPDVPVKETNGSIGIDVGINHFLTTDTGIKVSNPRFFKNAQKQLRIEQRALARKKRGSGNRARQRAVVRRLHERIANRRKTFHWEVAAELCSQDKTIVVEDLNIKGLAKSKLAKSVRDVALGQFFNILGCKVESTGIPLIKVDPKYTSQKCSGCGSIVRKSLAVRIHRCDECGLILDRDHNAAVNIKNRAVASPAGDKVTGCGVLRPQNTS